MTPSRTTDRARSLGALLALSLLGSGTAAGAVPVRMHLRAGSVAAPATKFYVPSTENIANPDRGFYHYTETHYLASGSGYTPLDGAGLTRWRITEGVTLVYRIFYLEKFAAQDTIDSEYLGLVANDLAVAKESGVKLIVRFAYSSSSSSDAPAARVLRHIGQLAPVLNRTAGVIAAWQAGFIGQWGEWYYTDNFSSDPSRPWVVSDNDWANRGQVLDALLREAAAGIRIQVRYPAIKQRLAPNSPRIGLHDDCFLASADDYGTFTSDSDRTWLAEQTQTVPMSGETCAVNVPRSSWASAQADLRTYHWSFLNADYNTDVLNSWGQDGLGEARLRLGYRLRLVTTTTPTYTAADGTISLSIALTNDGYAAPFRPRTVQLVLQGPAGTYRRSLPVDVRQIASGATLTVPVRVAAPARPGSYRLYLALPEAAPGLVRRPAYALQLANVGTWDPAHGWNALQQTVSVTGSAGRSR